MAEGQTTADLAALEQALGHRFGSTDTLALALTHASVGGMDRRSVGRNYERLEFLGDRVLSLVVAEWLLERFPTEPEGAIARRHTALVRAEALVRVAEGIDLGRHLRVAPGEQAQGGATNPTVLADGMEAVIAALYLDGGLEAARHFIRRAWEALLNATATPPQDPKSALQEWTMAKGLRLPSYELRARTGPDHAPAFEICLTVTGRSPVTASGPSKRAAEKAAAEEMMRRIRSGEP